MDCPVKFEWRVARSRDALAGRTAISRDILQTYLETLGCRVSVAKDGNQAILAAKDCADWIDIIVLDALMAGPEPGELYNEVRAACPEAPILICSGLDQDDSRLGFVADCGLTLLRKPFRRVDLHQAIENVLNTATAAHQAGT